MAYSNRPCKTGEAQPDPFVFVLDRDPCAACSCADAAHTSSHPSDPPQAQPSPGQILTPMHLDMQQPGQRVGATWQVISSDGATLAVRSARVPIGPIEEVDVALDDDDAIIDPATLPRISS